LATVRSKSKSERVRNPAVKPPVSGRSRRHRKRRKSAGAPPKGGHRHENKQGRKKTQPVDGATTLRIRGALRKFLESELGFLTKAQSLLMCIAHSMDESTQPDTGPYYPDVIGLASDLLGRRAVNLDEMLLAGRLSAAVR
jgi:hypothetical protein